MAKKRKPIDKLSDYRILSNKDDSVISSFKSTKEAAESTLKYFKRQVDCRMEKT